MERTIFQSRLLKLFHARNAYLFFSCSLIVVVLFLCCVIYRFQSQQKTIVVPAVVHTPFWISSNDVSDDYLAEMAYFFANLYLNVSPENAVYQRDTLLRYTDPKSYDQLSRMWAGLINRIRKDAISTVFYPSKIKVNHQDLSVQISGQFHTFVGQTKLPIVNRTYELKFNYEFGRLTLKKFQQVERIDHV